VQINSPGKKPGLSFFEHQHQPNQAKFFEGILSDSLELKTNEEKISTIGANSIKMILKSDTISELQKTMGKMIKVVTEEVFFTRKRRNLAVFEDALKYIPRNSH